MQIFRCARIHRPIVILLFSLFVIPSSPFAAEPARHAERDRTDTSAVSKGRGILKALVVSCALAGTGCMHQAPPLYPSAISRLDRLQRVSLFAFSEKLRDGEIRHDGPQNFQELVAIAQADSSDGLQTWINLMSGARVVGPDFVGQSPIADARSHLYLKDPEGASYGATRTAELEMASTGGWKITHARLDSDPLVFSMIRIPSPRYNGRFGPNPLQFTILAPGIRDSEKLALLSQYDDWTQVGLPAPLGVAVTIRPGVQLTSITGPIDLTEPLDAPSAATNAVLAAALVAHAVADNPITSYSTAFIENTRQVFSIADALLSASEEAAQLIVDSGYPLAREQADIRIARRVFNGLVVPQLPEWLLINHE